MLTSGTIEANGKAIKDRIQRCFVLHLDMIKADEEITQIRRLRKKVPVDKVIKACCDCYGMRLEGLLGRGKDKLERQIKERIINE